MKIFSIYAFILSLFVISACNSQTESYVLDPLAFDQKIGNTPEAIILDVRTPGEFAEGYINKAVNVDFRDTKFDATLKNMDKSKPYFVYCLSGGRSGDAARIMRNQGFEKVYELKGGILAWKKEKMPLAGTSTNASSDKSVDNFKKLLRENNRVLIDFYAPWCGPCKKMAPMMEELKKEYTGKISIVKINVDDSEALSAQLGISQIPLFHYYEGGKLKWKHEGLISKKELIKQLGQ
jgi:thioredoxin 1